MSVSKLKKRDEILVWVRAGGRWEWRALLTRIKRDHSPDCSISLFPAVPISVAVQLGRVLLPKADPVIRVYDYRRDDGGFRYALTV